MRERQRRLKAIKQVIRTHAVDSQEQILQFLADDGFRITQATLSRDLKLLGVVKLFDQSGGYLYTMPTEEMRRERQQSYVEDFERGYVSIAFSGSLVVVRTLNGHADSVAIALDNLSIDAVLGTVAGDDTVFVALREDVSQETFLELLRERVPELEE